MEELHLQKNKVIASLSSKKCKKGKNSNGNIAETSEKISYSKPKEEDDYSTPQSPIAENMDEKILDENPVVDTTNLDKVYTWKDCEINPDLNPKIKRQLQKILEENNDTFARTKLDVGKFPHFTVQLEIDEDIPLEKFRPMSKES